MSGRVVPGAVGGRARSGPAVWLAALLLAGLAPITVAAQGAAIRGGTTGSGASAAALSAAAPSASALSTAAPSASAPSTAAVSAAADSAGPETVLVDDPDRAVELRDAVPADLWAADGLERGLLGMPPEAPAPPRRAGGPAAVAPRQLLDREGRAAAAGRGRLTLYGALGARGVGPTSGRASWDDGVVSVLLRARREEDGSVLLAGGAAASRGAWAAAIGNVETDHGLGLLSASAGRWRSLSAAAPLARAGLGWSLSGALDAPRAVAGLAVQIPVGGGALQLVRGASARPERPAALARAEILHARWAREGPRASVAVLVGSWEEVRGGSVCGGWAAGPWSGLFESALWRAPGEEVTQGAAVAGVAWAHERGWRLDLQAAAGWAREAPPHGSRPAVLPAPEGRGWAVRAAGPFSRGVVAQALLAEGEATSVAAASGTPERARNGQRELAVVWRAGDGWRAELRWTGRAEREIGWRNRSPWLPPAAAAWEERSQLAATVSGARGPWRWRLSARTLRQARVAAAGENGGGSEAGGDGTAAGAAAAASPAVRRAHFSCQVDRGGRHGWLVRLAWGSAWGEPIDLATISSPWPGLSVPRHWGGWSGETSAGLGWRARRWEWGVALARRWAAAPPAEWGVWQRFGLRW